MSTPTYVVLTQDYTDEKNVGTVQLTKGEIYKVSDYDPYDQSDSHTRILIGGKTILVPTNLTIKIINLQPSVCVNANAGGKKKRTRRNKRVKSRRRIKGKSVRRSRK